jgi:hypothetical protein
MIHKHKSLQHARGQGLVEFALVIPIVLLLMVVFIDLGRAIYMQSALSNAVREGARYAIVHKETGSYVNDIKGIVRHYSVALNPSAITFTPDPHRADCLGIVVGAGETPPLCIFIKATYLYDPITPGLKSLVGGTIPLQVETQMQIAPIGLP